MEKKVEICSNALLLLGHTPISSFDEPGSGALLAKNLYESTYRDFLSSTNWNFSKKYGDLNRLTTSPEHPMYKYQFQIPVDFLRLDSSLPATAYEIIGDKIYTNQPEMHIEYVFRCKEEFLPPYAVKCMQLLMASTLSIPLTADTAKAQYYNQQYEIQKIRSMSIDSQNAPGDGWAELPVFDVRFG